MNKKQISSKISVIIFGILIFLLIYHSDTASGATHHGIDLCVSVLIPSLFPFMFISSFMVKSGCALELGRLTGKGINRLTGLPPCAATVIIIALLGGYPAGAQTVSALYSQGELSKEEAEKLLCFCVCAGPVFLCETIGRICFGSFEVGIVLLVSQIISTLLLGAAVCIRKKDHNKQKMPTEKSVGKSNDISLSNAFVSAVSESAAVMLKICAYVIIFTVLICILDVTGFSYIFEKAVYFVSKNEAVAQSLLYALSETSAGCMGATSAGIPFTAFAALFGGFCVHFQIFSLTFEIGISKLKFIFFRFIHGILAAVTAMLILNFVKIDVTCASVNSSLQIASPSGGSAVALFALCLAAVVCREPRCVVAQTISRTEID